MKTEIVAAIYDRRRLSHTAATEPAVELLRKGEVVALPTETVYGLAADALNPIAVARIFETKERPRFDPVIVHLPDRDWLEKIVEIPVQDRSLIENLINRFWPGPFTLVLPKREIVPEIATAGLETVAIRMSAHPVFAEVIRAFGGPLAAPSANRFGRISPTTAQHVRDELDGRIPLIIDAGSTIHGIESTIVSVQTGKIGILRTGPITAEQLFEFGRIDIVDSTKKISAPGQLPSHYAPSTPLCLVEDAETFSPAPNQRCGLLAWTTSGSGGFPQARRSPAKAAVVESNERPSKFAAVRHLSERQDLREAAANLFRYLRELDALDLDLIVAERVPPDGLGAAILDRLVRAEKKEAKSGLTR